MSGKWQTEAEKDDVRRKRRAKSFTTPWGSWVRKTQAPIWKKFIFHEDNFNILWNMDCNDEVRDHLKGFLEGVYINSDYFKGNEDIFRASFRCPWQMRDLYQYMVVLYRSLKQCEPVERYKHFHQELGYLEDADGRRLDFTFLLPQDLRFDFYVRPEDIDAWERMVAEDEGTLPPEDDYEPMSEEELDWFAATLESSEQSWKEYLSGKGGTFRLEGEEITRKSVKKG